MVKLAVTFVGFPEDGKEEKKASNEKKVKKTKKAKRSIPLHFPWRIRFLDLTYFPLK